MLHQYPGNSVSLPLTGAILPQPPGLSLQFMSHQPSQSPHHHLSCLACGRCGWVAPPRHSAISSTAPHISLLHPNVKPSADQ
ncbi:hypothetical protein E2C01_049270 [Portunus trituberculatus]|uniref:Uncharacterized protein n=1 Tax=Portunus trituberculatus TaxID=210409 RepID=A0A5B7GDE9_PORTR|nr:hypothetical protein [Portunus trituberculatus]